ncbi:helix-turn-helix domain-containing protein [Clostridium perfringens]|uniref:helix-turn-helix domain-containing protein n=1 Tax=Clostridium perfringens TaxID=1502 RepID=UPI0013E32014|nr:helix-turn-helix domain-containing protein [Clostridium perfringens]EJT5933860.1 helix-turn-helix domain-containing protein [Clostridium perfringens]MDG6893373.1 Mga helix-turn-helix domain protein [Clostridium perfringens]MDH2339522.1 helix-turn-helix domain-containing protein [Clostridium perfringens]NGT59374.1 helix-turn-helix domain-containing protein [Clostridium perfringens]HDI3015559.1 helix-turn-helix domain-containing protein [Clostridium perfringens]
MFKENLLESSEKIEIEILKKLYINNGRFSKYKLCDELHISFPTLKLYIKNINIMFLDHYNNEVHVYIDKETIFLKYVTNISLDNFVSIYIENSLKYKILSMIYYHKNLNSIKLCEYLNISLSTLNRKINECNKLLSSFELRIKKFELKGSPLQFSYFYYSLFRNSGINKEIEPGLNDENLVKFLEKSMSIDFTYTQKLSVHIWSKIIFRHKNKFTKENFLDKFSLVNLDSFKDDITFKNLELFYSKFPLYKKYLAYSTTCFLKSFGILSFENEIDRTLPFNVHNFILLKMKSLFLNKDFEFDKAVKSNILAYCNKQFYFKGVFYSIDKNTRDFYLNSHLSFLKNYFILDLFRDIKLSFKLNNLDFDYFKLLIVLNLSYIDEESKYTIKIGVLSKTENLALKILLKEFNTLLRKRFNAKAEIFSEKNLDAYDLIITNIHDHFSDSISNNIFKFTYLGVEYDLNNLTEVLNNIEKEKIENFKLG